MHYGSKLFGEIEKKKQNVERAAIFIALWVFAFWLSVRRVALLAIVKAGEKVIDILCLGPLKCIPCKHALTQSYKHTICVFTYIHTYVCICTYFTDKYLHLLRERPASDIATKHAKTSVTITKSLSHRWSNPAISSFRLWFKDQQHQMVSNREMLLSLLLVDVVIASLNQLVSELF